VPRDFKNSNQEGLIMKECPFEKNPTTLEELSKEEAMCNILIEDLISYCHNCGNITAYTLSKCLVIYGVALTNSYCKDKYEDKRKFLEDLFASLLNKLDRN
jgi:hypothetical protein